MESETGKKVDYLREIDVVGTSEDHLGDNRHVFLTHIRRYEEGIARNVVAVMDEKPWTSNVEIDEKVGSDCATYLLKVL